MLRNRVCFGVVLVCMLCPLAGQNVITTIAGIDSSFNGDGRQASTVPIGYINGVATDGAGNVYFTDPLEHLVLRVAPSGILSVIAGNGIAGYSGDGGPATSAAIAATDSPEQYVRLIFPERSLGGVAVDQQGNVYFGDGHRVRMVSTQGIITTVAGGGNKTANASCRRLRRLWASSMDWPSIAPAICISRREIESVNWRPAAL